MTDIPIIFSGPMVRALLAGHKTMTRRLAASPLRRAVPGDRLWVRESLKHVTSDPVTAEPCSLHCYAASIPDGMDSANPYEPNYLFSEDGLILKPKSIPSIHMPRWASRLTLTVTAVKVERLNDISEADAKAEGVRAWRAGWSQKEVGLAFLRGTEAAVETSHGTTAQRLFYLLWTSLHGEDSWKQNPAVIAISFKIALGNINSAGLLAA